MVDSVVADCQSQTNVSPRYKVMIFFPNIAPGGTERVIQTLLPHWHMYEIHCVLLDNSSDSPFESLPGVEVSVLGLVNKGSLKEYVHWLIRFREVVRSFCPDVLMAFGEVPIVISALHRFLAYDQRMRLVSNVRNHESTFLQGRKFSALKMKLLAWAMNQSDIVTGNSFEIKKEIREIFKISVPINVIYNPIDLTLFSTEFDAEEEKTLRPIHVINVGRFNRQKGQEFLLRAVSKLQVAGKEIKLSLVGQGEDEKNLRALVSELALKDVSFIGWSDDIKGQLSGADIFCLSSLWEGMPNVLLEALSTGLPIVSFDCHSGPSEILDKGRCGILVPVGDVEALAGGLLKLIERPELRHFYKKVGLERARDFDVRNIAKQWTKVIEPH